MAENEVQPDTSSFAAPGSYNDTYMDGPPVTPPKRGKHFHVTRRKHKKKTKTGTQEPQLVVTDPSAVRSIINPDAKIKLPFMEGKTDLERKEIFFAESIAASLMAERTRVIISIALFLFVMIMIVSGVIFAIGYRDL
nr:hypothetical protein [Sicyoidochytrium minutum DNA virus]